MGKFIEVTKSGQDHSKVFININAIIYVENDNEYCKIELSDGSTVCTFESYGEIVKMIENVI